MSQTMLFGQSSGAGLSSCGRYRYWLHRDVGPGERTAVFVMLNPSTADATRDDPTIRRCKAFARTWDCGRLSVLNLFAWRASDPASLASVPDPVGVENREWFDRTLNDLARTGGKLICAWGVHGRLRDQDRVVMRWIGAHDIPCFALGLTKEGYPRHPLYVRSDTILEFFHCR